MEFYISLMILQGAVPPPPRGQKEKKDRRAGKQPRERAARGPGIPAKK